MGLIPDIFEVPDMWSTYKNKRCQLVSFDNMLKRGYLDEKNKSK